MSEAMKYCENCGTACSVHAFFCPGCKKILQSSYAEETVNGIRLSEWRKFIEKDKDWYIALFRRKEHQKFFFHINWKALLFGDLWLVYRKMYFWGVLAGLLRTTVIALMTVLMLFSYKPQMVPVFQQMEEVQAELLTEADPFGQFLLQAEINNLERALNQTLQPITAWATGVSILFQITIGLLGNCLYRNHILKKRDAKYGGVSQVAPIVYLAASMGMNLFLSYALAGWMSMILLM